MDVQQIIKPPSKWSFIDFREIYRYRHLLYSLAWRDIKVRYAQTYVGLLWAIINPILTIVILSFVFQKVAKVDIGSTPPLLFTLVGYVTWSYFSALTSGAGDSIIASQSMVQKIYFPKLVLPLSKALSAFVEFFIVLVCIFVLMIFYRYPLTTNAIWIPIFLFLTIICGLTGGIIISALTVRYRDFKFITPLLLQLGLFITPIAYPVSSIPSKYLTIYHLNPMASIIEGFRWSVLSIGVFPEYLLISFITIFLLLVCSLVYFSTVEKIMADIL